jgi:SAM-dependent methyltransferase
MTNSFELPAWYRESQATNEHAKLSKDDGHQIMSKAWMSQIDWTRFGTILDVGCADGWSMEQFRNKGLRPIGITLCEQEAARARQFGIVHVEDMHNFSAETNLDACWLRHVLEHAIAPYMVMKNIRAHLRKGARLFTVLPSPAWDTMPQHFSPMNEHQFAALATKTGFRTRQIQAAYHKMHGAKEGSPNDFEWWIESEAI